VSINLTVRSSTAERSTIRVHPRRVILGGYSARSAEVRERHITELREIGIEPPERVPAFWHVSPRLLTTGSPIDVQGERTSGEIEYALIAHEGRTYVAAASDQTDREFERHSIPRSKQLCSKVLSVDVVVLDHVIERWDEIVLTSEVSTDGTDWRSYQRSALSVMLDPRALVRACCGTDGLPDGTVLLSGTIPLLDGVTRYDAHFRGSMTIPGRETTLTLAYRVDVMPEIETKEEITA
jgi:hypothetical protein